MIEFHVKKSEASILDLTPMIDVVFLLLIFFMLTSALSRPSMSLNLPEASAASTKDLSDIQISVDENENIFLNGQPTALPELETALKAALAGDENRAVVFRGDRTIPYQLFVGVMDAAQRAGAKNLQLEHEYQK